MSQHDLTIDNASRTSVRLDAQSALQALGSCMKGPSAPSVLYTGMLWLDDDTPSSTTWTLKQYDGSDWIALFYIDSVTNLATPVSGTSPSGLQGFMAGWTSAPNASDPSHDIDIAAGRGVDSTGVAVLQGGAMTKRYDDVWAAGNGNGGRSGSAADGDWWIHACLDVDDQLVDYVFSQSRTAPTLPSGYTLFRPIGWFRVASSSIVAFKTYELPGGGLEFKWTDPREDVRLSATLTATRRLDALSVPVGISVVALITPSMYDTGGFAQARICCPDEADAAVYTPNGLFTTGVRNANMYSINTAMMSFGDLRIRTDTSGRIAARASAGVTADIYVVQTNGFEWSR